MIDKERLAEAALDIAQQLGRREEWADPAAILEGIAERLKFAGLPDPGAGTNAAYWENMSVEDALDQDPGPAPTISAYTTADGITSVSVNIDAGTATPEAIAAIFAGVGRLIRGEPEPRTVAADGPPPTVHFIRSADL